MSNREILHLEDEDLLRLLDGELPEGEASESQTHMEACWKCRTRMEEFGTAIGEYVRYRENALKPSLPPPPVAWIDLRPRLEEMDGSFAAPRLLPIVQRSSTFRFRPAYWAAVAACLVLGFILIRRLERPPAVSAAELLHKAVVAQSKIQQHRVIQIKTRRGTFSRPASVSQTDPAGGAVELKQMFDSAPFSWEEPLSAKSYAAWRDQLREKHDQVEAIDRDNSAGAGVYVIRTTTSASTLQAATLTLRAEDLRPLREMLEFTSETVEITDVPQASDGEVAETPANATPGVRAPARVTAPSPVVSTAGQELEVFSALHRIGADLGEPIEIRQGGEHLTVIGTGLTSARQAQVQAALSQIPGVELRFLEAKANPRPGNTSDDRNSVTTAPLQPRLQALLGSRESAEDFTNHALDASDAMMARVHALRALARAFPRDIERSLSATDQAVLGALRSDHAQALSQRIADLRRILKPVISQAPSQTLGETGANWQTSAESLFAAAQQFDTSLNACLAGPGAGEDAGFAKLAGALSGLQAQFSSYERTSR
jgi:anti-sigma factor RsiW